MPDLFTLLGFAAAAVVWALILSVFLVFMASAASQRSQAFVFRDWALLHAFASTLGLIVFLMLWSIFWPGPLIWSIVGMSGAHAVFFGMMWTLTPERAYSVTCALFAACTVAVIVLAGNG